MRRDTRARPIASRPRLLPKTSRNCPFGPKFATVRRGSVRASSLWKGFRSSRRGSPASAAAMSCRTAKGPLGGRQVVAVGGSRRCGAFRSGGRERNKPNRSQPKSWPACAECGNVPSARALRDETKPTTRRGRTVSVERIIVNRQRAACGEPQWLPRRNSGRLR